MPLHWVAIIIQDVMRGGEALPPGLPRTFTAALGPGSVNRRFSGFKSRWMIPRLSKSNAIARGRGRGVMRNKNIAMHRGSLAAECSL